MLDDEEQRAQRLYTAGKDALKAQFDAERELVRHVTDVGQYHTPRGSLTYARCLLRDGTVDERAVAARMIEHVLAVQERQSGNSHEGNFPWMIDDGHVTDLNAVEFVLEQLCHILLASEDTLPATTRDAIRSAIRLGLAEVARLDVNVAYTNICLLDIHNSILGGQLLGAPSWTERGIRKLDRWATYTAESGAPREFNSPTYCGVDLVALASLAEHTQDPAARLQALLMEERLWLHVATHYHAPTAQLAGPHSRAYQNDVTGGRGLAKMALYKLLGDERLLARTPYYPHRQGEGNVDVALATYHCPPPVRAMLTEKSWPFAVREIADTDEGLDISSELTADWALGVASRQYGVQSNNLILHYRKEMEPGFGLVYTRFIINDKRIGSFYHASGRSRLGNLNDEGQFRGLQHRNKAIGIYGLAVQTEDPSSIKLDVFIPGRQRLGRLSIGSQVVQALPTDVPLGTPVVLEDGAIYVGLIPLRHSNLGRVAPVRLEARDDDLVVSTVLYEGPPKRFWEYSSLGGHFYHGNVECGLIVEVASRSDYPSGDAFAAHLAAAGVEDVTVDGVRTISYRSGGDDLLLRYRLSDLVILARSVNGAPFVTAPLASPLAVQASHGVARLGSLELKGAGANWLYTSPAGDVVTATRADRSRGALELRLRGGRMVVTDVAGPARLVCSLIDDRVDLETVEAVPTLVFRGWTDRPSLAINGRDVTLRLRALAAGEWMLA